MRRVAWIGLTPFLAGCFLFSGGRSSRIGETPDEYKKTRAHVPPAEDLYPYGDPAPAPPGEWARYRIVEKGESREITIGVCARDKEGVWVEVVEEYEARRASARLVGPDGVVLRAFYREVPKSGAPGAVQPQEIRQVADPSSTGLTERSRSSETCEAKVGTRSIPATEVKVSYEDVSGRRVDEEWMWSLQAPRLFGGGEQGGLVRKKTASQAVELLDFGTGYRALVEIPK